MTQLEKVIEVIEKHMRVLDRQSRKCAKEGQHQWASVYYGRVMGLCQARDLCLEEAKKKCE